MKESNEQTLEDAEAQIARKDGPERVRAVNRGQRPKRPSAGR